MISTKRKEFLIKPFSFFKSNIKVTSLLCNGSPIKDICTPSTKTCLVSTACQPLCYIPEIQHEQHRGKVCSHRPFSSKTLRQTRNLYEMEVIPLTKKSGMTLHKRRLEIILESL